MGLEKLVVTSTVGILSSNGVDKVLTSASNSLSVGRSPACSN